jgi:hypothetical protein
MGQATQLQLVLSDDSPMVRSLEPAPAGSCADDWHLLSGTRLYSTWASMHRRCHDSRDPNYCHYGGRGIRVCDRWNDVRMFLVDMGHPPLGMSIGRVDNDGDYTPDNCRWETQEQQNENTRRNVYVTWQGRSQTIKAWARELNMDPRRISERLRRGWSVERTMQTPCPVGYEQGRRAHMERARADWAAKGSAYRAAAKARRLASDVPA